ncbi:transglutaminase-like domain-containing protein [Mycoplasma struthionis]|uniref:Transglutaminase domain-containing protein n=1 Tax=Mycoplasma struthionis TaxID=538220 RepID=A0A502M3K7_9MOLU|nr:transglutaminase-like domain-containing protein [Mycoplasma struthionis]TPI01538.1 transglutaminase domain-containing protein [Mycoplasma struthionis]
MKIKKHLLLLTPTILLAPTLVLSCENNAKNFLPKLIDSNKINLNNENKTSEEKINKDSNKLAEKDNKEVPKETTNTDKNVNDSKEVENKNPEINSETTIPQPAGNRKSTSNNSISNQPEQLYDASFKINDKGVYTNPALFKVEPSEAEVPGFDYGDAPLIKKKTKNLTEDDLVDMFDFIIGSQLSKNFNFGKREISPDLMASAYTKWITKNWIKFPYFSLAHTTIYFILNEDKTAVKTIWSPKYASSWWTFNSWQESYVNFVSGALSKIKEGMTDYEKAYAIWLYVSEFFKYDSNKLLSALDRDIFEQRAVCAVYAAIYGYLLNLVGIEALVNLTGTSINSETHEVVYVKLQLPGQEKDKWYLSDATWAFSLGNKGELANDLSTIDFNGQINFSEFLSPIGKDPDNWIVETQFGYSQFWKLPWKEFRTDNWYYGDTKSNPDNKNFIFGYVINKEKWLTKRSRYEYYKKDWYTLIQNPDNSGKKLYKRPFYSSSEEVISLHDVDLNDLFKKK